LTSVTGVQTCALPIWGRKKLLSHLSDGTKAYLGGGCIPPPSARGRRGTTMQPPQWAERIAVTSVMVQRAYLLGGGIPPPSSRGRRAPHYSSPRGRKGSLSHLSDVTTGVSRGRGYTAPVGSGTPGHHTAAAPGGGKDSSVTSVTVQRRISGAAVYSPRRLGDRGAGHRSRPRGRNSVPRRNEPRRTDCRSLRPSYTARHRARSTTTHRPQKVPRTAREATNYHAARDIAITGLREARRPPKHGGWKTRYSR
jgi:hypothetical protein